jgi:hypothetical protein
VTPRVRAYFATAWLIRTEMLDRLALATISSQRRYPGATRYPSVFTVFATAVGLPRLGFGAAACVFAMADGPPPSCQYSE